MVEKMNQKLESIVIGLRFRPNFAIMDKFGSMIDGILYSKKSYFNEKYFPYVHHAKANERVLYDNDNKHFLTINPSNVILDTKEESGDYSEVIRNYKNQLLNGIFDDSEIQQVQRIGFISRYEFEDEELCKKFLDTTISDSIKGINDINLRFSKKYPITESKMKKDVFDYHNSIYSIVKKADENILKITIDFQRYYEPILERPSMINFDQFVSAVNNYNDNDVKEWLNNFINR